MRVIDGLLVRARGLGRIVDNGVVDSRQAVLYLRQLLRGNRAEPSIPNLGSSGSFGSFGTSSSRTAAPTAAPSPPACAPPVLLIHGYLATRGSVHLLERRLADQGRVVMTYRLGPIHMGDIRESAGYIARKIESLSAQTGVDKVDVVAHSMGGLVALDYLKRLGGQRRIRRLVLLGTPILGTWSALLGILTVPLGRASLQLLPGSAFLRELAELPMPPGPEVTAIAADRDWLAPPRTTVIAGIRNLVVATGHSGLLVDDGVAQRVSDILAADVADTQHGLPTHIATIDGSHDPI
jgi:pimeloyl-ACP methyl ester carboxylesterase